MVGVAVRQHQGEQARIGRVQAGDCRHKGLRLGIAGVERQPEVEQDALAAAGQFDAGAADLPRAAMDADVEAVRRRRTVDLPLGADHGSGSKNVALDGRGNDVPSGSAEFEEAVFHIPLRPPLNLHLLKIFSSRLVLL